MVCDSYESKFYVIREVADSISTWIRINAAYVPYAECEGEFAGIFDAISSTVQDSAVALNSEGVKQACLDYGDTDVPAPFILTALYWQIVLSQVDITDLMRIWCGMIHGVLKMERVDYTDKANISDTLVISTLKATLRELFVSPSCINNR